MSTPSNPRAGRLARLSAAQFLITLVAVGLAVAALVIALRIDRRYELEVDDGVTSQDAEAILERANEAAAFADSVLSFMEVTAAVIGIIAVIGAWMLRNSIQRSIDESREFIHQTETRLDKREKELNDLEASLTDQLKQGIEQTKKDFGKVQQQANDSFRVLSLLVLAEQQVRAHNVDTAIRTLQTAYALDSDSQATNYLLGYLYTLRKRPDEAIERLEHALRQEPGFAPAIAALGLALRRKGDAMKAPEQRAERDRLWAEAEAKLLEALSVDSRLTDAEGESYYGTLGGLYRRQQRHQAALEAYEKARHVTPNSSYPINNLAALSKHQGQDDEAARYYQMVLKTAALKLDDDPLDYWTRADYAQARLVLGEPEAALEEMRRVLEHTREHGVLETVRSGLGFLAESPTPIPGLDRLLDLLDEALNGGDGGEA